MELAKQDRNGARTPSDVERRYNLGKVSNDVEELKDEVAVDSFLSVTSSRPVQNKVITQNLNNKVNAVSGKGLSTNDFTNEYKNKIDGADTNSHTHSNKTTLDIITNGDIQNWDAAYAELHSHLNKAILDQITSVLNRTTLYTSSGSNTDITLNNSVVNFDFIDIVYGNTSNIVDVKRVYNANGKNISLSLTSCSGSNLAIRTENDTINGTTITRGARNKVTVTGTNTVAMTTNTSIVDADKLLIYQVYGYNI